MYTLEQIDIHLFGGNATSSLKASVLRSLFSCIYFIWIFICSIKCWFGSSRNVFFSLFCALLTAISYHLSLSSSDPAPILNILKTYLWPNKDIFSRPDMEYLRPKKKLKNQRKKALNKKKVHVKNKMHNIKIYTLYVQVK